jgi:hypothetical protein
MSTEEFVASGLRSMGFDVRRIETGPTKTPDFLITDADNRYLIEIKDKLPDSQLMREREKVLGRGGIWLKKPEPLGYTNAISSVVHGAVRQLAAFRAKPEDFRLVWLHACGPNPETQVEQFKATLFGCADLIDLDEVDKSVPARPCFYFGDSEFYRHRDVLDGAFVSTDEYESVLYVNTFSKRARSFTASRLWTDFQPGVCNALERESKGEAYIADCEISRKDKRGILEYVQKKYSRPRLLVSELKCHSAEVVVRSRNKDAT